MTREISIKIDRLAESYGIDPKQIESVYVDQDFVGGPRLVIIWKNDG